MSNPFVGNTHVTAAERAEHEDDLIAKRIVEIPSNMEGRWEYDANDNCIYAGYAPKGLPESSSGWLIQKFRWVAGTVSGFNCVERNINYGNWTSHEFVQPSASTSASPSVSTSASPSSSPSAS